MGGPPSRHLLWRRSSTRPRARLGDEEGAVDLDVAGPSPERGASSRSTPPPGSMASVGSSKSSPPPVSMVSSRRRRPRARRGAPRARRPSRRGRNSSSPTPHRAPPPAASPSPKKPATAPAAPMVFTSPPPQYEKASVGGKHDGSAFGLFWDAVARVQEAHASLDEFVAYWFGLDQSKYQWALNDYYEATGKIFYGRMGIYTQDGAQGKRRKNKKGEEKACE